MIIDSFDAGAAAFPDRTFVQGGDMRMSYSEAADASHAVAAGLVRDVQPGTHVAVLSPNHPMVLPAMLGVMRSGAVYVPLNARDPIEDIVWFAVLRDRGADLPRAVRAAPRPASGTKFRRSSASSALTEPLEPGGDCIDAWARISPASACVRRGPDDIALIKSSGGTTGRPKAIMQSHRSLETAYRITNQFTPPRKDPVHLVVAPLTHAAGATNGRAGARRHAQRDRAVGRPRR